MTTKSADLFGGARERRGICCARCGDLFLFTLQHLSEVRLSVSQKFCSQKINVRSARDVSSAPPRNRLTK